jgi:basic amino acid/polyamine antiporter, APA family
LAEVNGLRRELGLLDTTFVVMGGIIGVGIFVNPGSVVRIVEHPGLAMLAWLVGGGLALIGGLSYAEIGSRLPYVGGQYVYLARGWHPMVGYLYGISKLFIVNAGACAAIGIVFAQQVDGAFVPLGRERIPWVAAAAILVLALIQYFGVRPGKHTNNLLMAAKLAGIAAILGFAAWKAPAAANRFLPLPASFGMDGPSLSLLFAALVPVLFAYGGWENCSFIAGEIKDPERTLARGVLLGVFCVVALYLLLNVTYLWVLPAEKVASSTALGADVAEALIGKGGRVFMAGLIGVSCLGILSVVLLTGPRLFYAMANEGLFFARFARLHPRHRTPSFAIAIQALAAVALVFTNTFDQLLSWVVFADWLFFGTTVATLFRLRHVRAGGYRIFKAPGHPLTTLVFVGMAYAVVVNCFRTAPQQAIVGAAILACGALLYPLVRRRKAGGGEDPAAPPAS